MIILLMLFPMLAQADALVSGVFRDDGRSDTINCPTGKVGVTLNYRNGEGLISPQFMDERSKWHVVKDFGDDKISEGSEQYNIDMSAATVYRLVSDKVSNNARLEYQLKCF